MIGAPLKIYSRARGLGFFSEYLLLNSLMGLLPGAPERSAKPKLDVKLAMILREAAEALITQDISNIENGVYPAQVLWPESPFQHIRRLPLILWDGIRAVNLRRRGNTTVFTAKAQEFLEGLPKYYQRNFHFQSDGYLSDRSAKLYEHQVEILFGGTADAMRRLIIAPMKKAFAGSDGTGLTFLEVAAGTGRTTRFVKQAFPKARIVVSDLSEPYLKFSQSHLSGFSRLDFVHADGAKLPFRKGHFDAVYSVFLFHELPEKARIAVIKDSVRVLKEGGFFGLVDSVQKADFPGVEKILENFPKMYHEPFYRHYIEHPLEDLFERAGLKGIASSRGYFSKCVTAQK